MQSVVTAAIHSVAALEMCPTSGFAWLMTSAALPSSKSLPAMFLDRVAATPNRIAYRYPASPTGNSSWKTLTWRESLDKAREIALGLRSLGLDNEERAAILSGTRIEWILCDLGIMCAGGATTTIYPSNTGEETAYIINDSSTKVVFAESMDQVKKLEGVRGQIPGLKHVVVIDEGAQRSADGWVLTLEDLCVRGREAAKNEGDKFEARVRALRGDQLATLIYTSGTTGRAKGVELVHDCWVYEAEGVDALGFLTIDEVQYLWLPLAHVFGKVLQALQIRIGFETAVDGRIDKIIDNLAVVKPTMMAAVPRIFEKVYNKVIENAKGSGGAKWKIFQWANGVGRQVVARKQEGQPVGLVLSLQNTIADKLVFSKIRARFGGRLRWFVSGSAPLSKTIGEFFYAANLTILEGYGLTETSAASTVNRPGSVRFGTVGPALGGTQIKIAEDGEILLKGRGVMRGYHNMPNETAEAFDAEGWFRTGDIGELDTIGRLRITDRKKELIKTSGGKYVAPQALESRFKTLCPNVSQLVVHGDNRNYCSALIAMEPESMAKWTKENGVSGTYADWAKDPKVIAFFQGFIDQLNAELPSYSTVKKFVLLPADMSVEAGDLTPSLKLKRKFVEKKHKDLLDGLYKDAIANA